MSTRLPIAMPTDLVARIGAAHRRLVAMVESEEEAGRHTPYAQVMLDLIARAANERDPVPLALTRDLGDQWTAIDRPSRPPAARRMTAILGLADAVESSLGGSASTASIAEVETNLGASPTAPSPDGWVLVDRTGVREETVRMIPTPGSSNVAAVGYAPDPGCLYVVFKSSDTVYRYRGVDRHDWADLTTTVRDGGSVGTFVNRRIKPAHAFDRLTEDGLLG